MLQAVRNAFKLPDLRRRILFTFGILVIYRLASHIPVPNVDLEALRQVFETNQLLGMLDMFSGGAMSSFSVMAMGVYPYITASIIMQLLVPIIPQLEEIAKEGEAGQNKINQYTHWLTVPLALLQAYGQATLLSRGQMPVLRDFGFGSSASVLPTVSTLITLTAGTVIAVWLGELITEQGIGNGVSIIIFGGIVARVPQRVGQLIVGESGILSLLVFLIVTAITVLVIVFIQEGQRRIPVQYGKRVLAMRGNRLRVAGGQSTYVPLRVNSAGMIPLIFAQSILIFPGGDCELLRLFEVGVYRAVGDDGQPSLQPRQQHLLDFVLLHGSWFHLLLYRRDLPSTEPCGEFAEAGWVHSGHSSGEAYV